MPNLNSQQQAIVDFTVSGHGSANVVARAGCGKTFTLVNGVVVAIRENNLGTVALMAFNKSAATEFETRLAAMHVFGVDTGTVHSFGFRAWRKVVGGRINVDGYKVSNIVRKLYGDVNNRGYYQFLPQVTKLVSLAKQSVFTPEDLFELGSNLIEHFDIDANGSQDEIIENACEVLRESNKQRDIIDFDDMIYLPVLNKVRVDTYDFVLIDEAQDTNEARRQLAFMMMKPNARLIAVGDDKQAIYGFTGANSDSMQLIKDALNSVEFPLTVTYRCPKAVVKEANRLVPDLTAHETAPEGIVRHISSTIEVQNDA